MEVGLISRAVQLCPAFPTPKKRQCPFHELYRETGVLRVTTEVFMCRVIGRGFKWEISKE